MRVAWRRRSAAHSTELAGPLSCQSNYLSDTIEGVALRYLFMVFWSGCASLDHTPSARALTCARILVPRGPSRHVALGVGFCSTVAPSRAGRRII